MTFGWSARLEFVESILDERIGQQSAVESNPQSECVNTLIGIASPMARYPAGEGWR